MITVYTDGSARGNPGPGGFGAIVIFDNQVIELAGSQPHTTNNRMEMMAVIEGLKLVRAKGAHQLEVRTDSQYVIKGMTEWIHSWQKKNWVGSNKKPVLNRDLWENLLELSTGLEVTYSYVRGHTGDPGNERADTLATEAADGLQTVLYNGLRSGYPIL